MRECCQSDPRGLGGAHVECVIAFARTVAFTASAPRHSSHDHNDCPTSQVKPHARALIDTHTIITQLYRKETSKREQHQHTNASTLKLATLRMPAHANKPRRMPKIMHTRTRMCIVGMPPPPSPSRTHKEMRMAAQRFHSVNHVRYGHLHAGPPPAVPKQRKQSLHCTCVQAGHRKNESQSSNAHGGQQTRGTYIL